MVDERNNIKIIDLGLSAFFSPGEKLTVYCGSPSYVSPEIISHIPYLGPNSDIWSLGVLIFGMVVGYLPFYASADAKADETLERRILRGRYRLPSSLSSQVRDLIKRTLVTNPALRISLRDMHDHPWLEAAHHASIQEEDSVTIDEEALALIETRLGHSRKEVLEAIRDREVSDVTACYFLLSVSNRKRSNVLHSRK